MRGIRDPNATYRPSGDTSAVRSAGNVPQSKTEVLALIRPDSSLGESVAMYVVVASW